MIRQKTTKFEDKPILLHFDTKKVNKTTKDNITKEIERLAVSITSPDANNVSDLDISDDELLGVIRGGFGQRIRSSH